MYRRVLIMLSLILGATLADAEELFFGDAHPTNRDDCSDVGAVIISAGWWIDGIQIVCFDRGSGDTMPLRGSSGGRQYRLNIAEGERIQGFEIGYGGPQGPYIYTIRIHTDRQVSDWFGGDGGHQGDLYERLFVRDDQHFAGLLTHSGQFLRGVGLVAVERRAANTEPSYLPPRKGVEIRSCKKVLGLCVEGPDCVCR